MRCLRCTVGPIVSLLASHGAAAGGLWMPSDWSVLTLLLLLLLLVSGVAAAAPGAAGAARCRAAARAGAG
jgi:hypothetical protein